MSKVRLSVKLLIGFLSVAMIVLIVGLFGIKGEMEMNTHLDTISQESLPAITQLNRLNFERLQIRAQTYEVKALPIWSPELGKELEQLARQREASWRNIEDSLAKYEVLPHNKVERTVYEAFLAEYKIWRASYEKLDSLVDRMSQTSGADEYAPLFSEYSKIIEDTFLLSDRVGVLIESMVALKNQGATAQLAASHKAGSTLMMINGIGILVGLILSGGLGVFITRDTLRQLGDEPARVVEVVNRIASGDLASEIKVRRGDETSLLAAISRMASDVKNLLGEVSSASDQVATAATQLASTSEQTREQVQIGQSETDQVATAMNEMLAAVEEVARHAASAASAAQDTDRETEAGGVVVNQAIAGIESLAMEVEEAGKVIERLSDDSKEIGAVLDVIRGVAEQTNLLALNAAIEAARAGEQGRGFAVVAAEVRTLASRTQSSIQDIQGKIERVQNGSMGAVRVMEKGQAMARESVDQAQKAGVTLQTISASITSISDMNRQIASAADEQTAVAEEINRNIHNISATVDQTSEGSEQIAASSDQLSRLSMQLQERVDRFKI